MELLGRYELILVQGLAELGPLEIPADQEKAFESQAFLAPLLGDILYRLAIEHGVAFNPFRETVISMITDRKPALATNGGSGEGGPPFAARLQAVHPLILLALEMMPPDSPF